MQTQEEEHLRQNEAYTYASLLLFGTEDAISSYLPGYKFELLFHKMTYGRFKENRPEDIIRYDDRRTLRKNIIQSYGDMMDFIKRYLPDKFYLPTENGNTSRMDLRVQLFREIIGNLCAHSDYSRQCAGYLEMFYDRVITRNATRVVPEIGEGNLSLDELGIYTKNPLIVKVLSQLQWVENLGSGMRNIKIYAPLYFDGYEVSIKSGQQFESGNHHKKRKDPQGSLGYSKTLAATKRILLNQSFRGNFGSVLQEWTYGSLGQRHTDKIVLSCYSHPLPQAVS